MFFVLLLGAVAFVLPVIATSFSGSATKIVAAILFFFGPLLNVVTLIPMLSQVNVTVDNLQRLESTLDEGLAKSMQEKPPAGRSEFFRHDPPWRGLLCLSGSRWQCHLSGRSHRRRNPPGRNFVPGRRQRQRQDNPSEAVDRFVPSDAGAIRSTMWRSGRPISSPIATCFRPSFPTSTCSKTAWAERRWRRNGSTLCCG